MRRLSLPNSENFDVATSKSLHIGFVLAKDFTLSALSLFIDTLRLASDEGDRSGRVLCDWDVISSTYDHIRSSAGVEIAPNALLCDPSRFTHIAVVGGLLSSKEPIDAQTKTFLNIANKKQIPLIGVCTGSFILADSGLMQGRKACVSWFHHRHFRDRFPDIDVTADRLFFVDGNRITCAGGAGSADLAAYLVDRRLGLKTRQKALQVLQIEKARAPSDPQPRLPVESEIPDDRVRRAMLIMEQNLAKPLPVSEIAERCGLAPRSLERLFQKYMSSSPTQIYIGLRLAEAKTLVLTTRNSVIDIALSTGFEPSHFSRMFKREFGKAPKHFRISENGHRAV